MLPIGSVLIAAVQACFDRELIHRRMDARVIPDYVFSPIPHPEYLIKRDANHLSAREQTATFTAAR